MFRNTTISDYTHHRCVCVTSPSSTLYHCSENGPREASSGELINSWTVLKAVLLYFLIINEQE